MKNKYQEALQNLYDMRSKLIDVNSKNTQWANNIKIYDFIGDQLRTLQELVDKMKPIEEELGCPLEVVFKAIVDGIVIIGDRNEYADMTLWLDTKPTTALIGEKRDFEEPRLIKYNEWCFSCNSGSYSGCVKLKDYKKTWWLSETKEE